jgi:regulatory protein
LELQYDKLLQKVQKFCAYSERSEYDVIAKLRQLKADNSTINKIVNVLKEENFLNEERFVNSFINGKLNYNKWGKIKIMYELRKKNISESFIQKAIYNIDNEKYKCILKDIIDKKAKTLNEEDTYNRNAKLVAYAVSKGFEQELIWQLIKE